MKIERDKKQLIKAANDFLIDYFRWLATIMVLAVFSIGAFFVVLPKYQEVSREINETLTDQENKYRTVSQYVSDLRKVNAEYRAIDQASLERMRRFLPTEPETESLLVQIEALANRHSLSMTNLNMSPEGKKAASSPFANNSGGNTSLAADIGRVKISLAAKNVDYNLVKDFLVSLEHSLRLLDVFSVNYYPALGTVNLEIYAYYLKSVQ
ncbi:type 4a pilus biogenesis protein PilO [Candidatus Falkowbacteria bacterium]|nr:type 4a pilus biogenesis protein PilO [Candidatus Falkowbacteria bacterium]